MTYSDLVAHIIAHTNRADLADVVDMFIAQATSEINEEVHCSERVVRATTTISTQITNLPSNLHEIISVQNNGWYGEPIPYVTINDANAVKKRWIGMTDTPKYYTVINASIELIPAPDTGYEIEIVYFSFVNTPSSSNPTSDMMTAHPQLFILGALKYAYDYLKEKDEYADKYQKFEAEKDKINKAYRTTVYGDGALHVRRRNYG